ncbi:MAG: S4 domain-containing protein, partial [Bacteroidota bacterium]
MKSKVGFEKFMSKEKKGAAKKEVFRQEKKKITKERKEFFEKKRVEARKPLPGAPLKKTTITRVAEEKMPLNKYIAHSGICSRRDAVEIIKTGKVKVNGEVVTEPGFKIAPTDTVIVNNKKIEPVKELVYILINKP